MGSLASAEDTFGSFASGLHRWHGFVEVCLDGSGPAGVVRRGHSADEAKRREAAEQWRAVWSSNPMELVSITGHSRLAVATSHVRGLALLLERGIVTASVATILRAIAETSARGAVGPRSSARPADRDLAVADRNDPRHAPIQPRLKEAKWERHA